MFHVSGVLAAAFPLVLYLTKVFDGKVRENIVVYVLMIIIAGGVLGHSYISLSAKTRKSLLESRCVSCCIVFVLFHSAAEIPLTNKL